MARPRPRGDPRPTHSSPVRCGVLVTYREKALFFALREVGVKESPAGSNRGPRVDQYQKADGLKNPDVGYPWCASFINWCFVQAGRPLDELGRSASVGNLLSAARKRGWAHTDRPQRGDLVCFDWGDNVPFDRDWPDHIGFVVSAIEWPTFQTVEGNTSITSNSNGGEVMRRTRHRRNVEAFIRIPGELPPVYEWVLRANGRDIHKARTAGGLVVKMAAHPWAMGSAFAKSLSDRKLTTGIAANIIKRRKP